MLGSWSCTLEDQGACVHSGSLTCACFVPRVCMLISTAARLPRPTNTGMSRQADLDASAAEHDVQPIVHLRPFYGNPQDAPARGQACRPAAHLHMRMLCSNPSTLSLGSGTGSTAGHPCAAFRKNSWSLQVFAGAELHVPADTLAALPAFTPAAAAPDWAALQDRPASGHEVCAHPGWHRARCDPRPAPWRAVACKASPAMLCSLSLHRAGQSPCSCFTHRVPVAARAHAHAWPLLDVGKDAMAQQLPPSCQSFFRLSCACLACTEFIRSMAGRL